MSIQEAGSHSAQQSGLDPLDTPARAVHKMDVGGGLVLPGDFAEALAVTSKAKSTFPERQDDLYRRGEQLILESVESGVTAMRAHVEVDTTVKMACLDVGLKLKEYFAAISEVQLSVFAQDPLFNGGSDVPGQNYELLALAAARPGVEAVGSAPYVEHSVEAAKKNILLLFQLAEKYSLHLDFHLDYNLDPSSEPLIWFVLDHMRDRIRLGAWRRIQHVCIGHATRLTLWTDDEWTRFSKAVHDDGLPVSLVGLPQSDIYMMGRNVPYPGPPRGTLNAVRLAKEHSLKVALAVNNVGNAFTPQGSPDPLALCALGIALFQVGTRVDCQILLVSPPLLPIRGGEGELFLFI
ncbi:hypothetical protein EW026_g1176 [Hermanssonia centrifuga]|uniref:Metallo-dependent hydrolase n=1 Tax=Hermanssonia centrifuga TaxID=98765 RepID=A0A4S4KU57_9APHY|nr:hypothetical protein EW026_g1176 [Hermanssonia centrifuga]